MRHARFLAHAIDYVHLVLHQCNQGRHHDGGAFHQERWQLVAERLAASRRHEHEGVIAVKQVADYLLLFSLETFEAEILLQFCRKINIVRHITSGFPFYFVRCAPVRLSRHTASCVFLIWIVVKQSLADASRRSVCRLLSAYGLRSVCLQFLQMRLVELLLGVVERHVELLYLH